MYAVYNYTMYDNRLIIGVGVEEFWILNFF